MVDEVVVRGVVEEGVVLVMVVGKEEEEAVERDLRCVGAVWENMAVGGLRGKEARSSGEGCTQRDCQGC